MRYTNQVLMECTLLFKYKTWTPREIANTHCTHALLSRKRTKTQRSKRLSAPFSRKMPYWSQYSVTCSPTCTKAIFLLFFFLRFFISWKLLVLLKMVFVSLTKCSYDGFGLSEWWRSRRVYTISWYTDSFASSQRQNTLHLLVYASVSMLQFKPNDRQKYSKKKKKSLSCYITSWGIFYVHGLHSSASCFSSCC